MNPITRHLPATLLLAQVIYLGFVPVSIAHSIVTLSLAGLYAFNQFLLSKQTPSLSTEISKLKSELEQAMAKQKDAHGKSLKVLEDELARISLGTVRSSSSSKLDPRKIQF